MIFYGHEGGVARPRSAMREQKQSRQFGDVRHGPCLIQPSPGYRKIQDDYYPFS